tara:strand:- start:6190 stop:6906 length:717 start_codon:yes stop_codon:yes gene_type:complete
VTALLVTFASVRPAGHNAEQLPNIRDFGFRTMSPLEMQPTFSMDFPVSADVLVGRVRSAIKSIGSNTRAVAAGKCIEIAPPKSETRFWSPHLSVQIGDSPASSDAQTEVTTSTDSPDDQSHCQLFGRFSPRPEIWTFCMFLYLVMAMVLCGGLLVGYVQWSLGASLTGLWLVPISLGVIGGLHAASLAGQGLSRHQMIELREQLDQILDLAIQETPTTERPGLSTADQTPTMHVEITS